jgi:hypothetical protein
MPVHEARTLLAVALHDSAMAKLSAAPVGPSELLEYLNSVSDSKRARVPWLRRWGVRCKQGAPVPVGDRQEPER